MSNQPAKGEGGGSIYETYKPPGFHTVCPYIIAQDPGSLLSFYVKAFHAVELERTVDDGGIVRNIILRIGDTCFMIGYSGGGPSIASNYLLYVKDPDALYQHALDADCGAKSVAPVKDQDYNDRQGGLQDIAGNTWWITKRLKEEPY